MTEFIYDLCCKVVIFSVFEILSLMMFVFGMVFVSYYLSVYYIWFWDYVRKIAYIESKDVNI